MKRLHFLALLGLIAALFAGLAAPHAFGYTFQRDLTVGSQGEDVAELQALLVSRGVLTLPAGVAPGYFGELTRQALVLFQASERIYPAAGYFGPLTRSIANTISVGTVVSDAESDDIDDDWITWDDWSDDLDDDPWGTSNDDDDEDDEEDQNEDDDESTEPLSIQCVPSSRNVIVGQIVQFDVEVSGGGSSRTYQWTNGFDTYYAEPQVRFDSPGTYVPIVVVSDQYGNKASDACPSVTVKAASSTVVSDDDDNNDDSDDDDQHSDTDNDESDGCYIGGCSRELCTDQPNRVSGCIWRESFACYPTATCERQSSGQCGWTMDDELEQCIADAQ
jgi:hypothetical protein